MQYHFQMIYLWSVLKVTVKAYHVMSKYENKNKNKHCKNKVNIKMKYLCLNPFFITTTTFLKI